jgi:DNA mismatch repair ATPase MutS
MRGRVAAAAAARCGCLLSFLDHTATACGARLLRANILQVRSRDALF